MFGYLVTAWLSPWYIPFLVVVNFGHVWSHIRARHYHHFVSTLFRKTGKVVVYSLTRMYCVLLCLLIRCMPRLTLVLCHRGLNVFLCAPNRQQPVLPSSLSLDTPEPNMSSQTSTLTPAQQSIVSKAQSIVVAEWKDLGLSSQHFASYISSARETIEAWMITKQGSIDTAQSKLLVTATVQRLLSNWASKLSGSTMSGEVLAYAVRELQVLTPTLVNDGFLCESEVASTVIGCFGSKSPKTPLAIQTVTPLQSCDVQAALSPSPSTQNLVSSPLGSMSAPLTPMSPSAAPSAASVGNVASVPSLVYIPR